ncbi:minor capsid protein [Clostridium gasigenes]|uniref:Phage putative head morphogenesis protein, SPP1 gp7 family n=1 Tax=Clostridium gasigenes TaxID=94869 RepID=A0A1H0M7B4_9CLOT|nr:minor capsid protein [Clostridium gasigenes]SDO76294.1 phage putative head morphogenesis protein, SPP1 gp7 family [Clostridium gasigenes]
MKSSEYWEQRIANGTWKTYNDLEQKNKALLEMYQEASLNISEELYKVAEKLKTSTPMLSDMHKFARLTDLQSNMENVIRELGESVEKFGKDNMQQGFRETYSSVMVELGKTEFAKVPKKVMEEMMDRPWLGSSFSERLWKNTQVLATNLNDIITNGITQGKTITEMAIQLNNRMNSGFNVSHRLIRTETMHYLNESAFKGYKDGGCEEVEVWAAQDERTCEVCGAKHGKVYKIKDRPTLPLHANCRCTYLPVVDLSDKKGDNKIKDAKNFDELEISLKNILEIKITNDVKSLDFEAVKETCVSMQDVFNEFPQIKGFVSELYTSKSGMMSCSPINTALDMTKISFNPAYYKEQNKIKNIYLKDVASGFHPKGTTYEISGVHELGHAVEAYLIKGKGLDFDSQKIEYWNGCTIAKTIVSDACKNVKKLPEGKGIKNAELKNNISGYALSDASECMAEAFSDYFGNGDKASILSKEIIKIVKVMMA